MDIQEIILMLTPIVVWGVTQLVKFVKPKLSGWVLTGIVVPALSVLITIVSQFAGVGTQVWQQILFGLLAVFLQEFFKQLNQGNDKSATATRNQL